MNTPQWYSWVSKYMAWWACHFLDIHLSLLQKSLNTPLINILGENIAVTTNESSQSTRIPPETQQSLTSTSPAPLSVCVMCAKGEPTRTHCPGALLLIPLGCVLCAAIFGPPGGWHGAFWRGGGSGGDPSRGYAGWGLAGVFEGELLVPSRRWAGVFIAVHVIHQ